VFAVRDSVGGRALPSPQPYYSEGSWPLEHALPCACMWDRDVGPTVSENLLVFALVVISLCAGWGVLPKSFQCFNVNCLYVFGEICSLDWVIRVVLFS